MEHPAYNLRTQMSSRDYRFQIQTNHKVTEVKNIHWKMMTSVLALKTKKIN